MSSSWSSTGDRSLDDILEEFFEGVERGESPDPNEFTRRYPHLAEELTEFFADWQYVGARIQRAKYEAGGMAGIPPFDPATRRFMPSLDRQAFPLPTIGGFQILEEIGSGGQGVVYRAVQIGTARTVALKVIREGAFATSRERRRFENEVRVAAQLKHPNIASVYECGRDGGRDFFAMEFIDGAPLNVYLAERTLGVEETIALFLPICDAVACAHRQGVIHRDLKPSNILVDPQGRPHVLDFGLAKRVVSDVEPGATAVTQVGSFAGTWHYASPEQVNAANQPVDVRSDVYALGIILYEMLTDVLPYAIEGLPRETIVEQVRFAIPRPPSRIRPEIDDDLDTITLVALRKEPDRRYQSAAALMEELRRYLAGEVIEAKRDSPWYVLRKTLRYYRWQVVTGAVTLTVLVAFSATVTVLYSSARTARATLEARAAMTRAGQVYVLNRLTDLQRLTNTVAELEASYPDSAAIHRLARPAAELDVDQIHEILREFPRLPPLGSLRLADLVAKDVAAWVLLHDPELENLEPQLVARRLLFPTDYGESEWALQRSPRGVDSACLLSSAFLARALLHFEESRNESSLRSLTVARALALDLGDGATLFHKSQAIALRELFYGMLLDTLSQVDELGSRTEGYIAWILDDPCLPRFEPALIEERTKTLQLAEAALRETTPGQPGHINLEALDAASGGLYRKLELLTPQNRDLAEELGAADMIQALDLLFDQNVNSEVKQTRQTGSENLDAALRLLRPLLPSIRPIVAARTRVDRVRSAAIAAARLCRFRIDTGTWPAALRDAFPPGSWERFNALGFHDSVHYGVVDDSVELHLSDGRGNRPGDAPAGEAQDVNTVLFRARNAQAVSRASATP
mgnify:FL=1